jgi:two-component system sensor histidine kinase RpfC
VIRDSHLLRAVRSLRERLATRADSEHEQAILRIVIVALVFAYMATSYKPSLDDSTHTQLLLLSTLAADLFFAFAIFVAICLWPAPNVHRRLAAMVADAGTATMVVVLSGEAGVSMVGVYLFITFGNGFRFGRKHLFACQALCLAGFLVALLFSPYWRRHEVAGWSLFISLVVLPLYVSTLLTRIQEARAKAEEANRAKSSFLANMSHEMRTPLNGIVGVVDLFNVTRLDAHQTELMRLLRHSVGVLRSLVDDVLDISKIEAGRLSIEVIDFDLHSMLNTLVRLLKPHAAAKNLQFRAMVDPSIDYHLRGDLHHLRQVLLNLLSNAIKFTHAGEITTNVTLVSENDVSLRLRFEVRDTGIGMAQDVQQRIFERFVQADESTTRQYGGTGLGTTIAKQLVELMSGSIGVTSDLGKGSTFWFEVPLTKSAGAALPAEEESRAAVLLADAETAARVIPSVESACGRVETVGSAAALLATFRKLQVSGVRVPAVLIAGDARIARDLFTSIASEGGEAAPALIYLTSDEAASPIDQMEGVSRIASTAPAKLIRNAVHAVAAQVSEGAQIINLGEVLAEQRVARRILVAEDNPTNRAIISQLLETAGHSVILAADGEEALDRYEEEVPDLAIFDFNMPKRNGLDVIRTIRTMEAPGEHLPIMVLSASVTPEARENSRKAGADEFLGKPYEAVALLQSIERLARRANRAGSFAHGTAAQAGKAAVTELAPLIDMRRLADVEKIASDESFLVRLLGGFHSDVSDLLARLDKAVEGKRGVEVGEITHAIKGAAMSVGATLLAAQSDEIGKAAIRGGGADAKALLGEIRLCFERTDREFDSYLSRKKRASL